MAEFNELGGYEVIGKLGHGAHSTIFHVRDKRLQEFAMKRVVKDHAKAQRFVDQALLEHKIANKFDHPSLRKSLKVMKQGLFRTSEVLVLMEYVKGETLEEINLDNIAFLTQLTVDVADGLAQMHEKGFVHADIKPANIMVTREKKIKIIDFGQSCEINTVKDRIQGTPDYIAPEQVKKQRITPKTDIFNFGATLYWMITRQNIPTLITKKKGKQVGDMKISLQSKCPDPVELNPNIPPALSTLVMDCIQIDPRVRPDSMLQVRDRLDIAAAQFRARLKAAKDTRPKRDESSELVPFDVNDETGLRSDAEDDVAAN